MAAPVDADSSPPAPCKSSKGKAKMDDEAEAEAEAEKICGICHVDGRLTVRGELDCCAHFFCFVCIMAWGRRESRCPFCKARFRTVRRPPVPGRLPDQRIVSVPERNQVYDPQAGNGSITVGGDPYVNTICTVCSVSRSRDDKLLLLCDVCDSAAHTYCVGLGTSVPEGDWFCKDCRTQLRWQAENQGELEIDVPDDAEPVEDPLDSGAVDEEHDLERSDARSSRSSMGGPVPSIFDIVDDDDIATSAGILRRRKPQETQPQGSSAESQGPRSTQGRDNGLAAYHARIRLEVERARTLRNARNLDKRVRELRENWAALRDGSVGFAPHMPGRRRKDMAASASVATEHQRYAVPVTPSSRAGAAAASVPRPMPFSEEASTSLGLSKKVLHKDTHDARKAWKKLEKAKSSGGRKIFNTPASLNCSPSFSMGNRSTSYSPIDTIVGHKNGNLPNKFCPQSHSICGPGTKGEHMPPTYNSRGCHILPENSHASFHERMGSFQSRINQEMLNDKVASSIHNQHDDQSLVSSCSIHIQEKIKSDMLHPLKYSSSSVQSAVTPSLQLGPSVGSGSQSAMMVNSKESSAVRVEGEVRKSSSPDRHECKRKHRSERRHDQGSKRSRSTCKIAKREISSLAIRELKLLKIDKTHGSDRFKEVARTATHSILAACRFEHSPSQSLALSRPVCKHSPEVKKLKSSAITDFCRECLRNFVKEAISLALSGRQMDQTGTSC